MTLADTVRQARADILERTAQAIDAGQPLDQAGFTDALAAIRTAGVQAKQIAERHGMAVSTVTRWEQGVNHPNPALRKVLTPHLAVLARRCAQDLRSQCEPVPIAAIAA